MTINHDRQERLPITAVWQNWRFNASYDKLVAKQTLVLRINFGTENSQLRQAANRYRAFVGGQTSTK